VSRPARRVNTRKFGRWNICVVLPFMVLRFGCWEYPREQRLLIRLEALAIWYSHGLLALYESFFNLFRHSLDDCEMLRHTSLWLAPILWDRLSWCNMIGPLLGPDSNLHLAASSVPFTFRTSLVLTCHCRSMRLRSMQTLALIYGGRTDLCHPFIDWSENVCQKPRVAHLLPIQDLYAYSIEISR